MIEMTREEFEDTTSSLLSRTRDIAQHVLEEGAGLHGRHRPAPPGRRLDPDAHGARHDRATSGKRPSAASTLTRSSRWARPSRPRPAAETDRSLPAPTVKDPSASVTSPPRAWAPSQKATHTTGL